MMPPPHHMGHHGHGIGHHHGRGSGGVIPFRAWNWECGSEECGYHNFAKNVNYLRCSTPRSRAAVVADSVFPSPIDPPGFGMGPSSMASTPGPGPFVGAAGAFGSGVVYDQQFGAPPPNRYGMPSGMGAQTGGYPPMGGMTPSYAPSTMSHSSFGHPTAQAAFTGAESQVQSTGGHNGFYGNKPTPDPLAFLSAGLGGLSVNVENRNSRRNGNAQSAKSPA
jgi:hypothetical protein